MNKPHYLKFLILLFCLPLINGLGENVYAQKVGLVLSGGGAKGLAHIGVIKALEENNIPIDYITGTSMGGIIGGMYSAGYSPNEMNYIGTTKDFQNWVNGKLEQRDDYYFYKPNPDPSWLDFSVSVDSGFQASFSPNLINDIPLNFALTKLVAQSSAKANYNFDSLFIPFRCNASDVFSQEEVVISQGRLDEAIRATLTVPFIFRPIKYQGRYLFDGGLYNNFPVDVMRNEFNPDIVIGVNVSSKIYNEYPFEDDDELINQLPVYLFLSKSDTTQIKDEDIYIAPILTKFTSFDFSRSDEIIEYGYQATMAKMDEIKRKISSRIEVEELERKRILFLENQPRLRFKEITIYGLNQNQQKYVRKIFGDFDKDYLSFDEIQRGFFKLTSDPNFQSVIPQFTYIPEDDAFSFALYIKKSGKIKVSFGGSITSRPINQAYLGLQYHLLRRYSYSVTANFFTGRFYESLLLNTRINISGKIPLYLEPELIINNFDFIRTSDIFIENTTPTILKQYDQKLGLNIGFPLNYEGKFVISANSVFYVDEFSNSTSFISEDNLDQTEFTGAYEFKGRYLKNTLDRIQYPTMGKKFDLSLSYIGGEEDFIPGTTSNKSIPENRDHAWLKLKLNYQKYFNRTGTIKVGYLVEGVASNQQFFSNYISTLLSAPAFEPLADSRSLFLPSFRAFNYLAGGVMGIITIRKDIDLRGELYAFQPYKELIEDRVQIPGSARPLRNIFFSGTAALVYSSPIGPVSFSYNYYDDHRKRHGFFIHFGYILYNDKAIR